MKPVLSTWLSTQVSRVKHQEYRIDPRVPDGYLIASVLERALMRARGAIRFPLRHDKPFVGTGVRLKARGLLRFGRGVTFASGCLVDAAGTVGVVLGDNTSLGRNTRIEVTGRLTTLGRGLTVGDNVGLGADCYYGCAGGIDIGDDTIIGNFVSFHSENHIISDIGRPIRDQGVTHDGITVGRGCWIGAKVTVLDGARIGNGVVVAAGSVVTKGVYPDLGVVGGVPARLLRSRAAGPTGGS